jgi:hypothetical protein
MFRWLLQLLCVHAWSNYWLRRQTHPLGGIREWRCAKCNKLRTVHYWPIPVYDRVQFKRVMDDAALDSVRGGGSVR